MWHDSTTGSASITVDRSIADRLIAVVAIRDI